MKIEELDLFGDTPSPVETSPTCAWQWRSWKVEETPPPYGIEISQDPQIKGPEDVANLFYRYFEGMMHEEIWGIYVNTRNRIHGLQRIGQGSLNQSIIHPRETFVPCFQIPGVSGLFLVHNHPSGELAPSPEDKRITSRIDKAAGILGFRFLDHLIIGANQFYSFVQVHGRLDLDF